MRALRRPRSKPYATPERRSESARNAALTKWAATPAEQRAEAARVAVAGRWRGHTAKPKHTPRKREPRPCRYCGTIVMMSWQQIKCGADACNLTHNAARIKPYVNARRAQRREAPFDMFDPFDIYDRDGWVCKLCGDPVDRGARFPAPLSVSLDHIVPLSKGGHHTRQNVQCAHLLCNTKRGNRDIPA